MRVEPLYGLPVEEPGDVEGWSVTHDQPGDVLAEAIAAELDRIEGRYNDFAARLATLPMRWQAGFVSMNTTSFSSVSSSFYNSNYRRAAEAVVFEQQFDDTPAIMFLPNNANIPGFSIEASISNSSSSGFTANLAVAGNFTGTFHSRWIAVETTQ